VIDSARALRPDPDAPPRRVYDQLRVGISTALTDAKSRPLTNKRHRACRGQGRDPVTAIAVPQPTAEADQPHDQPGWHRLGGLRHAPHIGHLPAIGELHADMQGLIVGLIRQCNPRAAELGTNPELKPRPERPDRSHRHRHFPGSGQHQGISHRDTRELGNRRSHPLPCPGRTKLAGTSSKNTMGPRLADQGTATRPATLGPGRPRLRRAWR
jgi:hypothetical protein